jgi:hypothetical protein
MFLEPPHLREFRPDVPEDLDALLHSVLSQKDPTKRLSDAAELGRRLLSIRDKLPQRDGQHPMRALADTRGAGTPNRVRAGRHVLADTGVAAAEGNATVGPPTSTRDLALASTSHPRGESGPFQSEVFVGAATNAPHSAVAQNVVPSPIINIGSVDAAPATAVTMHSQPARPDFSRTVESDMLWLLDLEQRDKVLPPPAERQGPHELRSMGEVFEDMWRDDNLLQGLPLVAAPLERTLDMDHPIAQASAAAQRAQNPQAFAPIDSFDPLTSSSLKQPRRSRAPRVVLAATLGMLCVGGIAATAGWMRMKSGGAATNAEPAAAAPLVSTAAVAPQSQPAATIASSGAPVTTDSAVASTTPNQGKSAAPSMTASVFPVTYLPAPPSSTPVTAPTTTPSTPATSSAPATKNDVKPSTVVVGGAATSNLPGPGF